MNGGKKRRIDGGRSLPLFARIDGYLRSNGLNVQVYTHLSLIWSTV